VVGGVGQRDLALHTHNARERTIAMAAELPGTGRLGGLIPAATFATRSAAA
jgi:hypothetical protein